MFVIISISFILIFIFVFTKRKINLDKEFNPELIGNDIENYLNISESKITGILPWTKKRIIWNNPNLKSKSKIAVIYVHGFSASLGEIRPVPDILAENYNANLFFTRLSGHGINDFRSLKDVDGVDWYLDVQEAFEIGKRIGDKIIVVATSFGCTLVSEYLSKNKIDEIVLGNIFISPCYGIPDWRLKLSSFYWSKFIYKFFLGEKRVATHRKSEEKKWWSNELPIESIINLELSVEKIWQSDFSKIISPVIFIFCPKDKWISIKRIKKASKRWGGESSMVSLDVSSNVDNKNYHVILGDIKAPGETEFGIEIILSWLKNILNSRQYKKQN